jgi:hypothetical protein
VHSVQDTACYGINDQVNLVQKLQTKHHPPPISGKGKALYGERLMLRDTIEQTLPKKIFSALKIFLSLQYRFTTTGSPLSLLQPSSSFVQHTFIG